MKVARSILKGHCPNAAVVDVAAQVFDRSIGAAEIALMGVPRSYSEKFTLSRLADLVERLGLDSTAWRVDRLPLPDSGAPLFAQVERRQRHEFVLVTQACADWVLSYSGHDGWVLESRLGFEHDFTGFCLALADRSGLDPASATDVGLSIMSAVEMRLVRGFASPDECAELIDVARPAFRRSMVSADGSLHSGTYSNSRTSKTAACSGEVCDRFIGRASDTVGVSARYFEDVQCVKYGEGDRFSPHFDAPAVSGQRPSPREWTMLVYLNDDFEGGETFFPLLDLSVRPETGAMLVFRNKSGDGSVNGCSLHAGSPVSRGIKYACNIWCADGEN
ncbi:prolyl hydroxylase family protein [Luteimonas sp. SDU101]|uniref:prolyl hydroxylase family protein n=1 Tax=unclassified Luteimonas TaxID=2629088 RepID=UPI003EC03D33